MPELPEVETVVRGLAPDIIGRTLGTSWVDWPKVLDTWTLSEVNGEIPGRKVKHIFRRGKYICIDLDGLYMTVHLRMTGRLYVGSKREGDDKWVHYSVELDNGQFLCFSDARKFGRVQFTRDLDWLEEKLGPEPLSLVAKDWRKILTGSKRAVKVFLLDQKKVAGVGNIYADESLFMAGIKPTRPVDRLKLVEREKLGACVVEVLDKAINHEGATISWYRKPDGSQGESQKHFSVYGREGEPCYECGTALSKIVLGQRGTHFCRICQK